MMWTHCFKAVSCELATQVFIEEIKNWKTVGTFSIKIVVAVHFISCAWLFCEPLDCTHSIKISFLKMLFAMYVQH